MDAFRYFFLNLALWNILIATLAFLFGLLMGHWMWGQFKKRLKETGQTLLDTEAENLELKKELKDWRGKKNQSVGEKRNEDERHANELKAARDLAGDEKAKFQDAKRSLKTLQEELAKKEAQLEAATKAASKPKPQPIPPKESSATDEKDLKAWQKAEKDLRAELASEKRSKGSLREVIAGLKHSVAGLKKEVIALEQANDALKTEAVKAQKEKD